MAVSRLFVRDGTLRPIWRALIFFGIGNLVMLPLGPLFGALVKRFPSLDRLTIEAIVLGEAALFVTALIATAILARYEGRRIDSYGIPVNQAFKGLFWDGFAVGIVAPALVGIGMLALHGWVIHGFNLTGSGWILYPVGWMMAMIFVGIAEEAWYRGYILQTLTKSIGFWPASIVLSAFFAYDHYVNKTGENFYDMLSLVAFGVFICLSVRRTGTLWFAIGFHIAFDFMQIFVIGTQNGAQVPEGRLFTSLFPGPAWVNGGVLGTEASVLMYPVIVLMYIYLLWRYPSDRAIVGGR